jgi:hypothetical protein
MFQPMDSLTRSVRLGRLKLALVMFLLVCVVGGGGHAVSVEPVRPSRGSRTVEA